MPQQVLSSAVQSLVHRKCCAGLLDCALRLPGGASSWVIVHSSAARAHQSRRLERPRPPTTVQSPLPCAGGGNHLIPVLQKWGVREQRGAEIACDSPSFPIQGHVLGFIGFGIVCLFFAQFYFKTLRIFNRALSVKVQSIQRHLCLHAGVCCTVSGAGLWH